MDGTFTVSSQSDRSPFSCGTVEMCCAFYCVILPHCSHFTREDEAVMFNRVLFPTSAFDTDAYDDLKVISKGFVQILHDIKVI